MPDQPRTRPDTRPDHDPRMVTPPQSTHCAICGRPRTDIASEDELEIVGGALCGYCTLNLERFTPTWHGILTTKDPAFEAFVYGVRPEAVETYPPDTYPAYLTNTTHEELSESGRELVELARSRSLPESRFDRIPLRELSDRKLACVFPVLAQLRLDQHADHPTERDATRIRNQLPTPLVFSTQNVYTTAPTEVRDVLRGHRGEHTTQGGLHAFTS